MNYFELYDIPLSFNPDQEVIKQRFYALSKKYHPDFYINESQQKQDEVLELSTLNNKAFQVLKDQQKRLHYILTLKGVLVEGEHYALPQDFLMDMMDVNEALMDVAGEENDEKRLTIHQQIKEIENSISTQLETLMYNFDHSASGMQDQLLNEIKDLYYRNKYLKRIKGQM